MSDETDLIEKARIAHLPWRWEDADEEFADLRGHTPDWSLADSTGECIMWASCPSGDIRDMTIEAKPGVREFIQKACNSYHDLVKERDSALAEVKTIREMHARIMSWPPEDVERAKTVLLQFAAMHARSGGDGKKIRDSIDAILKEHSKLKAEIDQLKGMLAKQENSE